MKQMNRLRKLLLFAVVMVLGSLASAQTQQGFVKTKVSVQGRTAVLVNADDGRFSFPVTGSQFRLDSVKKQGYQMVDVEACTRTYKLSSNLYQEQESNEQLIKDIISQVADIKQRGNSYLCP
jgi:hypothetical protein